VRLFALALALLALLQEKRYRLPSTDLKQQVIWGVTCEAPGGVALSFGGQDQKADDGNPHTRIREGDAWKAIHEELRAKNPLQKKHDELRALRGRIKDLTAKARYLFFEGRSEGSLEPPAAELLRDLQSVMGGEAPGADAYVTDQWKRCGESIRQAVDLLKPGPTPDAIKGMDAARIALEKAAESLDAEPAARALSPLAFDAKTGLFILFGGDHLDYLTNDTWVFDPAKRRWLQRHPKQAPPPRANHKLAAAGDGRVVLTGGYTYTSTTDYVGGPYRDLNDGEWTYDIAADAWTGTAAPDARTYRTGRLHPDLYLGGPKPDREAFAKWLAELPANTWKLTNPPHLPAMNRDWGTAVLDPDRDLILRWSGGHSAHGGTDVLHFHLATNRWELPIPVELPLGQTYSNTEYPEGVNFNRRPWVTGHTYQNYGFDPHFKRMLFTGRHADCHAYDPGLGDWSGRFAKPKGMVYNSCFYTLTLAPTPEGLVCWTQNGALFRFDASRREWVERPLEGKLAGSVVDNSTLAYDSRRGQLLFWRKPYGDKTAYTGEIQAVDVKTGAVSTLAPEGREAASAVPYLCQIRYDAEHDLFLVGGTLPPGPDGLRRTPAYDPEGNRWVSLQITGDDPSGPRGRNVSLGLMYDARRRLFWAVDTNSRVHALRLDPKSADLQPLK
jgi:hypothetical protein